MYDHVTLEEVINELNRLKLEDFVFIFYSSIILANLFGNYYEKQYLKYQKKGDALKYNSIFELIFILNSFIYAYLFVRNYNKYRDAPLEEKMVYLVRVFGAVFLIAGILCFIYYQDYQRRKYV